MLEPALLCMICLLYTSKQLNKQADSTSIQVRKAELAEEMLRTKEALERITDVHNAE